MAIIAKTIDSTEVKGTVTLDTAKATVTLDLHQKVDGRHRKQSIPFKNAAAAQRVFESFTTELSTTTLASGATVKVA